jgi:hypothetical protein
MAIPANHETALRPALARKILVNQNALGGCQSFDTCRLVRAGVLAFCRPGRYLTWFFCLRSWKQARNPNFVIAELAAGPGTRL